MYAAAGAALCLSSSVAAFVMNKKGDETPEQPNNTLEKNDIVLQIYNKWNEYKNMPNLII